MKLFPWPLNKDFYSGSGNIGKRDCVLGEEGFGGGGSFQACCSSQGFAQNQVGDNHDDADVVHDDGDGDVNEDDNDKRLTKGLFIFVF